VLQEFDERHKAGQRLEEIEQAQKAAAQVTELFDLQQAVAKAQCILDCDTGEEEKILKTGKETRMRVPCTTLVCNKNVYCRACYICSKPLALSLVLQGMLHLL